MNIVLDTETSGLMCFDSCCKKRRYPDFRHLESYDSCRIVSISWLLCQHDKIVEQAYFVIKPDGFIISQESIQVHGITQQAAEDQGYPIKLVLERLFEGLARCSSIVAHNVKFDINVILSEAHRCGYEELVELIDSRHHICTMAKGREFLNVKKHPKLIELYKELYKEDLQNAHNALADTMACFKCYVKMFPADKSLFFFKSKEIRLTPEQQSVVYEDPKATMLVVAAAGSGKTTTTLTRIKHLIDNGVEENSIILTTFTWDAANDMRNKLNDILGYRPACKIGTIDGIAKYFLCNLSEQQLQGAGAFKHVGEYGYDFLELIRKKPNIIKAYQYLFVDEFQDINDVQFQIIQEFHKIGAYIYAVGDDAQNIYSFRGSNVQYMMDFSVHFPEAKTFMLTQNFRSTMEIVKMANSSVACQDQKIEKDMVANDTAPGKKPFIRYFSSNTTQTSYIVGAIKELIDTGGYQPDQIAILSPINQTLFSLEDELTKAKIPNICLEGKNDIRNMNKTGNLCLCTIHKSKGLEWDIVFLINMSDDLIPKMKNEKSIRESRRLFYVGITRAKKELYITYVANQHAPYVSRYVSELPRSCYKFFELKPDYLNGNSTTDKFNVEKTVDKLVELLDGSDYASLREREILPTFTSADIVKHTVFSPYDYSPIVGKEGLHIDFAIFLHTVLCRRSGNLNFSRYAKRVLSQLVLSKEQFDMYKRKNLSPSGEVYAMMKDKASTLNINLDHVLVVSSPIVPESFIKKIRKSILIAEDYDLATDSARVLEALWNISKCKRIVLEQRKRLLYKDDIFKELLAENSELLSNIVTGFSKYFDAFQDLQYNVEFNDSIATEIDIIGNDTIMQIKSSVKDDVDISCVLGLLMQSAVAQKAISKLVLLNPLRGLCHEIDVQNWNKSQEILTYCLHKRQALIVSST